MSSRLVLEEKDIIEYILEKLDKNKLKKKKIKNANYHHNSSYNHALSILKNGILSLNRLQEKGIRNFTEKQLKLLSDTESHINGTDGISLSISGLDDLYKGEEEYDSSNHEYIDFIISDDIKASRFTKHYGNEFVTFNDILLENIKSLDFRIIKLIDERDKRGILGKENFYKELLYKFNVLLYAAKDIRKRNLNIQLREMSEEQINLDIDALSELPILEMK